MRFCIMTLGTRGDVQPYVALAQEFIGRGHSAILCTGESFRGLVEGHGVAFAPAHSDLMAMLQTPEGQAVAEGGLRNIGGALKYAKEVVNPAFRKSLDDFFACAQGADVIVYHPKVVGAPDIALKLGVPCVSMPTVPITYPISEFPNMALAPTGNWGKALNRLSYVPVKKPDMASMKEINDFRAKALGLSPRKAGALTYEVGGKTIPIVCPVSPSLFREVHSWEGRVFLTGFLALNDREQSLAPSLARFLAEGSAPIAVSFSSMPLKNPQAFKEKFLAALAMTGDRAVVLTGETGLEFVKNGQILAIPAAPHGLLFSRVKGVLHHGGVGTMAAALASGVPQCMMPFSVDQPFWANRLLRLGLTPPPLREATLTAQRLAQALRGMAEPGIVDRVKRMGKEIAQEKGNQRAADLIIGIVEGWKQT